MNVNIEPSWKTQLQHEFEKPYFKELAAFVRQEYQQGTCYPKGKDIFSAFDHWGDLGPTIDLGNGRGLNLLTSCCLHI